MACNITERLHLYWLARHTTPFTVIWLWYYKRLLFKAEDLLMVPGIHYIVALPGGGKSSIIYDVTEELRQKTGKSAYVNVEMEFPKLDVDRMIYTVNRRKFEIEDFFGMDFDESKQKYVASQLQLFDTEHFCALVFDEWLSNFNHRMNKTNEYNQYVIPIITFFAKKRHQGMPYVYIASQIDTSDNQIMSFFNFIHEVEIVKDIPYRQWINDGLFKSQIIGWWVYSYGFFRGKKGIEKKLIKRWFRQRFTEDFSYFNSLNQIDTFAHLKTDNVNIRKVGYHA